MTSVYASLDRVGKSAVDNIEAAGRKITQRSQAAVGEAGGRSYRRTYVDRSTNFFMLGGSGSSSKGDNRVLVGIIATVVLFVGSFFLGDALAQLDDAKEESANYKTLRDQIKPLSAEKKAELSKVMQAYKNLVSCLQAKAWFKVATIATIVAGAVIALVGAVVASESLMLLGTLSAIASGAVMLLRAGYEYSRNPIDRAVTKIYGEVQLLKAAGPSESLLGRGEPLETKQRAA